MTSARAEAARWEQPAERLIVTLLIAMAFGGAYVHTQEALVLWGQPPVLAWAVAGIPDLIAAYAAIQLRRARRAGSTRWPARLVLAFGLGVTMVAQVATTNGAGRQVAAALLPAVAFALILWLVEVRPGQTPGKAAAAAAPRQPRRAAPEGPGPAAPARQVVTLHSPPPARSMALVPSGSPVSNRQAPVGVEQPRPPARQVIEGLLSQGPRTVRELADAAGVAKTTVQNLLEPVGAVRVEGTKPQQWVLPESEDRVDDRAAER